MSASVPEQVTNKIIQILSGDSQLAGISYFFGQPLTRQTPFIYVSWVGGAVEQETVAKTVWRHSWHVVCVDSGKEEDVAEKSVMKKIQRVYEVLRANPTLGGAVRRPQNCSRSKNN